MRATVYRFYSESDELLYVGCSTQAVVRAGQHASSQPWWDTVARATFQHFDSREEAFEAEKRAIFAESPLHNSAGKITGWPTQEEREERARERERRRIETDLLIRQRRFYRVPDLTCTNCGWRGQWIQKGCEIAEVNCPNCKLPRLTGNPAPQEEAA